MTFPQMWARLLSIGRDQSSGGYRRFAWTPVDHTLREWFVEECEARGLTVTTDRAGNQWGWWGDPDADGPGIVTGSHLDSVPDGGAFDGPLGVMTALAAVEALQEKGFEPKRPIGVVNFVDEEGARFGIACAGSRLITGALDPDRARALTDADGVTMAEAMRAAGHDPEQLGRDDETLARIGHFVETHIEQGRHLADIDGPDGTDGPAVGVGTGIRPHGRWRIDIPGMANHAGTTALVDRFDAMFGLVTAVTTARRAAEEQGCVATVGKVVVSPNGVNAVPSWVTAWLDARGADEAAVRRVVDEVTAATSDAWASVREESWTPSTRFDEALVTRLVSILDDAPTLGTGAGHDAGILANAGVSSAMLFIRNPTGVSHSPEEWADPHDCWEGVDALAAVLEALSSDGAG